MTDWADIAKRQTEREAGRNSNAQINFAESAEAAARRYREFRSVDPFPDIPPALLNSADIANYVHATGMIEPFYPDRLKTASYEVALLGRWFYVDGKGKRFEGDLKCGEIFELQPNSIAFVSVEPYFRLPDYIALRHNLKIDHIYKGLLVGTGPLIDPGFTGKIALPLHNLTENVYKLVGGKGIIWVEFTKLSPNEAWKSVKTPLKHKGSYTNFPAERTANRTVDDYVNDAVGLEPVPSSSSAHIALQAKKAVARSKSTRNWVRGLTLGAVLTLLVLIFTTFGQMMSITNQLADLAREIQQLQDNSFTPTPIPPNPGPSTTVRPEP